MLIVKDHQIQLKLKDKQYYYESKELPQSFFTWQIQTRLKSLKVFLGIEKGMPNFAPHTVVMNTFNPECDFPGNSCIKGLGMMPREEYLEELCQKATVLIRKAQELGSEKTFTERVQFLVDLYSKPEIFDKFQLSSIEMFKKKSYENAVRDPRANLLFYDNASGYSVMFNVICEFIPRTMPFYKYVTTIHDLFHTPSRASSRDDDTTNQDRYEFAYRFYIIECYDKTPGPNASKKIL